MFHIGRKILSKTLEDSSVESANCKISTPICGLIATNHSDTVTDIMNMSGRDLDGELNKALSRKGLVDKFVGSFISNGSHPLDLAAASNVHDNFEYQVSAASDYISDLYGVLKKAQKDSNDTVGIKDYAFCVDNVNKFCDKLNKVNTVVRDRCCSTIGDFVKQPEARKVSAVDHTVLIVILAAFLFLAGALLVFAGCRRKSRSGMYQVRQQAALRGLNEVELCSVVEFEEVDLV